MNRKPEHHDVKLRDEERQPCEVWTRVMGYLRPVSQFNAGKRSEHAERRHFREPPAEDGVRCEYSRAARA